MKLCLMNTTTVVHLQFALFETNRTFDERHAFRLYYLQDQARVDKALSVYREDLVEGLAKHARSCIGRK